MESYSTEQVRAFARRVRDGGKQLDSWEQAALDTARNQAGAEGAKLTRIVNGARE